MHALNSQPTAPARPLVQSPLTFAFAVNHVQNLADSSVGASVRRRGRRPTRPPRRGYHAPLLPPPRRRGGAVGAGRGGARAGVRCLGGLTIRLARRTTGRIVASR